MENLRFLQNPLAEYQRNVVLQQHFSPGDGPERNPSKSWISHIFGGGHENQLILMDFEKSLKVAPDRKMSL